LRDYATFEDVAANLPRFLDEFAITKGSIQGPAISGRRGVRLGKTAEKAARRYCAGRGTGAF
jgi:hypothetical protein